MTTKELQAKVRALSAENKKLQQQNDCIRKEADERHSDHLRIRDGLYEKAGDLVSYEYSCDMAAETNKQRIELATQRLQLMEKHEQQILNAAHARRRIACMQLNFCDLFHIKIISDK